ncbi:monooxygenase [Kaistia algarum]|uniref:FAD-dependent monooxygenase n=1 Tax=Kaistia algarum TaxID=2083279 RepID=UPI000CE747F0|nr:FAD-dependent monooxygenase [Kaistia algarum]MCX5515929.1 FAD-dependent monooxygenase [Kaistia algarum]PPE80710.1 monooxygenase [Kaistia algarum]
MAGGEKSSILVVGAGPVGLTLALALARHGVPVRIIEKLAQILPYCRAIGVTPRTLEVWSDLGVARDIIDAGLWLTGARIYNPDGSFRDLTRDYPDLPFSPLGIPQYSTESVLQQHLARLGVRVEREASLGSLAQQGDEVAVEIDTAQGRESATFRYVIGCDGAHSMVRKALDIAFEGDAMPAEFMLGDVHIDWDVPRGFAVRAVRPIENSVPDLLVAVPLPEPGRYRVSTVLPERLRAPRTGTDHGIQADRPGATLEDIQQIAARLLPGTPTLSDLRWSSIFRISMRLAARYGSGNVFIAGDACHIHPPTGGQGMNTGVQDAYNLAWKLALVVKGSASPALLDSYEAERRPVAADVVARTTEQSFNFGRDGRVPDRLEDTQVLVSYRSGPLARGEGPGNVAAGDRVPDASGFQRAGIGFPLRLHELLGDARFVLLAAIGASDLPRIEACSADLARRWPGLVRVIAILAGNETAPEPAGVELIRDPDGAFGKAFGTQEPGAWLVRPDLHIGLAANGVSLSGIEAYIETNVRIA